MLKRKIIKNPSIWSILRECSERLMPETYFIISFYDVRLTIRTKIHHHRDSWRSHSANDMINFQKAFPQPHSAWFASISHFIWHFQLFSLSHSTYSFCVCYRKVFVTKSFFFIANNNISRKLIWFISFLLLSVQSHLYHSLNDFPMSLNLKRFNRLYFCLYPKYNGKDRERENVWLNENLFHN